MLSWKTLVVMEHYVIEVLAGMDSPLEPSNEAGHIGFASLVEDPLSCLRFICAPFPVHL